MRVCLNGDAGKDTFGAMPTFVAPHLPTAGFPLVQADALKPHPTTPINVNGGFHVLAGRDDATALSRCNAVLPLNLRPTKRR